MLALDPGRKDAGLVVGLYRCAVGSLPWHLRIAAYLVWLETGATALRAGRPALAHDRVAEVMDRLARDPRPRAFGEEALWHHTAGVALARLGREDAARREFDAALQGEARDWVRGRTHFELARLAAAHGDRAAARAALDRAITLCTRDNDAAAARDACRLRDRLG